MYRSALVRWKSTTNLELRRILHLSRSVESTSAFLATIKGRPSMSEKRRLVERKKWLFVVYKRFARLLFCYRLSRLWICPCLSSVGNSCVLRTLCPFRTQNLILGREKKNRYLRNVPAAGGWSCPFRYHATTYLSGYIHHVPLGVPVPPFFFCSISIFFLL